MCLSQFRADRGVAPLYADIVGARDTTMKAALQRRQVRERQKVVGGFLLGGMEVVVASYHPALLAVGKKIVSDRCPLKAIAVPLHSRMQHGMKDLFPFAQPLSHAAAAALCPPLLCCDRLVTCAGGPMQHTHHCGLLQRLAWQQRQQLQQQQQPPAAAAAVAAVVVVLVVWVRQVVVLLVVVAAGPPWPTSRRLQMAGCSA